MRMYCEMIFHFQIKHTNRIGNYKYDYYSSCNANASVCAHSPHVHSCTQCADFSGRNGVIGWGRTKDGDNELTVTYLLTWTLFVKSIEYNHYTSGERAKEKDRDREWERERERCVCANCVARTHTHRNGRPEFLIKLRDDVQWLSRQPDHSERSPQFMLFRVRFVCQCSS